jgi:RNA-binding protein YlmH
MRPAASLQQLLRRGGGTGGGTGGGGATALNADWRRRLVAAEAAGGGGGGGGGSSSSSLRAREAKLGWVASEHRKEVAQCVELAERAAERWSVAASPFVPPPVVADARVAIRSACGDACAAVPWGGYAQAERCRVVVGPPDLLTPPPELLAGGGAAAAVAAETATGAGEDGSGGEEDGGGSARAAGGGGGGAAGLVLPPATLAALHDANVVAAIAVRGQFLFDPATHRDFLGAALGTGISRDRVGDVVGISERGAFVLVDPLLVEHFEQALTSVRSVPVTATHVALSELRLPPSRVETLRSVEASMRLDAVASAGFRVSRAKMGDLIKGGDVKLQWRVASKASAEVRQGDVVSVAGKGRLEVVSVTATKSGKFAVEMVRRS